MSRTIPASRRLAIRRRLLAWFDGAKRDLPWRFPGGKGDPYRVWISETMLQQTQVATVVPYYRRFLERFPTLRSLAEGSEDEVLALWSGLGYYARGRALLRAAREALVRHHGIPGTVEALRALPGFGPYTAGAVASIAFGVATPAVDGNAGRVLARLFLVAAESRSARFRKTVWSRAESLVRGAKRPGDLNQSLIELGALLCRPGVPRCERCPVQRLCEARLRGRERRFPRGSARAVARRMVLAVAICRDRGGVLLARRPSQGLFGGMWAPPVAEVLAGEDTAAAISSAIHREPSVRTGGFKPVGTIERRLTHRVLELRVYAATLRTRPDGKAGWRVASPSEVGRLGIPEAMRAALALAEVARDIAGGVESDGGGGGLAAGSKESSFRRLVARKRGGRSQRRSPEAGRRGKDQAVSRKYLTRKGSPV